MASILKVDKIRGTGLDSDTISLDGSGNITIPKNVTFTGTTTGAADLVKISETTASSSVANVNITSGFSSTFDTYYVVFDMLGASDTQNAYVDAFVGGSLVTDGQFGREVLPTDGGSTQGNDTGSSKFLRLDRYGSGNATGEGIQGSFFIYNRNSTTRPTSATGRSNNIQDNGNHNHTIISGSQTSAYRGNVIDGLRFSFASGNIEVGTFKLYGIK